MEKFITLNHLKMAVQSLLTKFGNDIDTLDNSLSPVAKTGSYNDLTNKPNINLNNYLKKTSEEGSIARGYSGEEYAITANDDNGLLEFGLNSEYLGVYAERNNRASRMYLGSSRIEMEANEIRIGGIVTPTNNTDAANKKYVDDAVSSITIPTAVSSLTNDSGYQNSTQVQTAINTAIGNINSFEVAVVSSLPASNIDDHTIYFVPQAVNSSVHDEYMYINNNWELIGTTAVDLSGYLQTSDIADWAKASTKPTYTASEVGAVSTSDLNNYVKTHVNDSSASGHINNSLGNVYLSATTSRTSSSKIDLNGSTIKIKSWSGVSESSTSAIEITPTQTTIKNIITPTNNGDAVNKEYVDNSISSLSLPTKTSDLTNDSGYITSYTETDPIFSASAAAGISSTDISNWNAKSNFSGSYNDLTNKPTIPTVPTNVSAFTNDSGYLTSYTETDPIYSASAAAGITTVDISNWNAKSDFSGSYEDLTNKPTIPTVPTNVSAFTNDAGYLTSFAETDPVFAASAAAGISASDISNWNGKTNNTGTVTSVRVQATSPVQSSTNTAQSTTLNTTISLASGYGDTQNPYASKTAKYVLAAPNAQNGVPTFRALVASDLPSIGNITNAGDITTTATIASGDRLIINDESASKIINSSITFGTNTKQYLANNGTWQNAYDDTALAARVSALENLEWATYYSGRSNPSDSQGQNGDIYLQY